MTLFDTSALVAALVGNHPQFTWADAQVQAAQERGPLAVAAVGRTRRRCEPRPSCTCC
ncbi:hypothetical protein M8445_18000 (plasmid) [Deinococcus aquaticus]|uniref:PIN domain-containing protein n=1 Tax=Deinococcus aquaticus TaxID=328692 RepID=A0ABY7V6G7_9DEIO|nr:MULTISPECIES: hypothetical protein [Deinococcus]WDA60797.1 hypothetical protein M8445_18000 [Deinococcus aquaticus]